jgi:hypothetical protein
MTDDLVKRLRCYADIDDAVYNPWVYGEAADRIEKLVEENGVLFTANVRLNSRACLDSDGYVDRIQHLEDRCANLLVGNRALNIRSDKLEAALEDALQYVSRADWYYLKDETRNALEGKDD